MKPFFPPEMILVKNNITHQRDRTFADRRAFVLAETAMETAAQLAAMTTPAEPAPLAADAVVDPNWQRNRERTTMRESAQAARRDAFLRVLGEVTYRALPLDEHEKSPFRQTIFDQTAELAGSLIERWNLTAVGNELLETVNGVLVFEDVSEVDGLLEASLTEGELGPIVEHMAKEIEQRVIGAVVANRERAARLEAQLSEVTNTASGDAELDEYRSRRALKRTAPTLMEALFIANRRVLSEGTDVEISPDVLMVESVCQFALIETLSSIGIMDIYKADVDALARYLSARRD